MAVAVIPLEEAFVTLAELELVQAQRDAAVQCLREMRALVSNHGYLTHAQQETLWWAEAIITEAK